jgi:hypothetical protein
MMERVVLQHLHARGRENAEPHGFTSYPDHAEIEVVSGAR